MATNMVVEDTSFEDDQLAAMTTEDVIRATRLLDNEIRILKVLSSSLSLTLSRVTTLMSSDLGFPVIIDSSWRIRVKRFEFDFAQPWNLGVFVKFLFWDFILL